MSLRKSLKTFCPLIPKQEFLMSWLIYTFLAVNTTVHTVVHSVNTKMCRMWIQLTKMCRMWKVLIGGAKNIRGGDSHISKGIEKHKSLSFISSKKLQHSDTVCEPKWQIPAPANWPQAICQFLFLLALQWWNSQRLNSLISNLTTRTPENQCLLPFLKF